MQSLSEVTLADFRQALNQNAINVMRVIYIGLATGAIFIAYGFLSMYTRHQPQTNEILNTRPIDTLTIIHLIFALIAIFIGKVFANLQFRESNLIKWVTRDPVNRSGKIVIFTPAQKCLMLIRISSIIRLGFLEFAAFFGLAALMIAVINDFPEQSVGRN